MKIVQTEENLNEKEMLFFRILFDETIVNDRIWIPKKILKKTGGINRKLKAKQLYELLLRVAVHFSIRLEAEEPTDTENYMMFLPQKSDSEWEGIKTDFYIVARYKDKLMQESCFDIVVKSVLDHADTYGLLQESADLLEKFLVHSPEYYQIYRDTQPVLIYKGENICHNVLNVFAERFGEALESRYQPVEYFDPEEEGLENIVRCMERCYKAVVGIQTYLFTVQLKNGTYLHNVIDAPKYNMILDHPIWMKEHLKHHLNQFTVLTHDSNYVDFLEQKYKINAKLFPPAGMLPKIGLASEKKYGITFVGAYGDYWYEVQKIHQMDRKQRFLANRFLLKMRRNPNLTAEAAWQLVLEEKGIIYTAEEYIEQFFSMRRVIYCVVHYYRKKVVEVILESGLQVDVFGDTWWNCPLRKYQNLICHPNVTVEESMQVWQKSEMSLNIMSWHKGGFTERMANIMLCKSVLVTDATSYLCGRFESEKDMLIFSLENISKLPELLKKYLLDKEKQVQIAENGYKKALEYHTWDCRAKEFLEEVIT